VNPESLKSLGSQVAAEYRITLNSLSVLSAHRSSSLVGTVESSTKFPWNSLTLQSSFFQQTTWVYLLNLLDRLVSSWNSLGNTTISDIAFRIWFGKTSGESLGNGECRSVRAPSEQGHITGVLAFIWGIFLIIVVTGGWCEKRDLRGQIVGVYVVGIVDEIWSVGGVKWWRWRGCD
jgi:hypothetical protein